MILTWGSILLEVGRCRFVEFPFPSSSTTPDLSPLCSEFDAANEGLGAVDGEFRGRQLWEEGCWWWLWRSPVEGRRTLVVALEAAGGGKNAVDGVMGVWGSGVEGNERRVKGEFHGFFLISMGYEMKANSISFDGIRCYMESISMAISLFQTNLVMEMNSISISTFLDSFILNMPLRHLMNGDNSICSLCSQSRSNLLKLSFM